jgi:hypothetical protein
MCPHTTIYVSACYYMCPHATVYVSSYYYIIYVSSPPTHTGWSSRNDVHDRLLSPRRHRLGLPPLHHECECCIRTLFLWHSENKRTLLPHWLSFFFLIFFGFFLIFFLKKNRTLKQTVTLIRVAKKPPPSGKALVSGLVRGLVGAMACFSSVFSGLVSATACFSSGLVTGVACRPRQVVVAWLLAQFTSFTSVCVCVCVCVCINIYIYIQVHSSSARERERESSVCVCFGWFSCHSAH